MERSNRFMGVFRNLLQNGDVVYYYTFKNLNGEKQRVRVGKKSEGYTEAYAKQLRDKTIGMMKHGETPPVKNRKRDIFTFENAYEKYLEWSKGNKRTWNNDASIYENHLKDDLGSKELVTITASDLEALKQKKLNAKVRRYKSGKYQTSVELDKTLTPKTVNHILATARQIINYAVSNGFVTNYTNPSKYVKKPKVENEKLAFFEKSQIERIMEELKNSGYARLYQLTALSLYTGGRFSEVACLTWKDVNFNTNLIYLKPTKEGNARYVAIPLKLLEVLKERKAEKVNSVYVVPNPQGKIFTALPNKWQKVVDELLPENKDAETQHRLTFHSLRHTHASWMAQSGLVDILEIQQQLGHKKLEMTLRYSHLIPDRRHQNTMKVFG